MEKQFYYLLSCLIFSFCCGSLFAQKMVGFNQLLNEVDNLPTEVVNDRVEAFIESIGYLPLIEDKKVIFLTKSGNEAPKLQADFNGFLNPRYTNQDTLGLMNRIAKSDWYYYRKTLRSDAIVNYRFQLGDRTTTDRLNPNTRFSFGTLFSFVQMPQYEVGQEIVMDHFIPKGHLFQDTLYSEFLDHNRTIHIYVPVGYDAKAALKYGSVYFHDGSFYISDAHVPEILDQLIARQKIEPVIAIFDDPVVRGKEYRGDMAYRNYIQHELIPHIDQAYHTIDSRDNRAVVGGSRGGLSALYLSHSTDAFSKCGTFSPAIHPKAIHTFFEELESFGHKPDNIFISGSIYDFIWYHDASRLKLYFENQGANLIYKELVAGHNISAWRTVLDDLMVGFFPRIDRR